MARIFISYKKKNLSLVLPLKEKIERGTGVKCWLDTSDIKLDEEYRKDITVGINDCEVFLFIYSRYLYEAKDWKKEWPLKEYNYAAEKKKRIVFINIDNSPLSDTILLEFGPQHQIDGTNPKEINRLIVDLKTWLNIGCQQRINSSDVYTKTRTASIVIETQQSEFPKDNSVSSNTFVDVLENVCSVLFYNWITTNLFFALIGCLGMFLCSKSGGGYDVWNVTGWCILCLWGIVGFFASLDKYDDNMIKFVLQILLQILLVAFFYAFIL